MRKKEFQKNDDQYNDHESQNNDNANQAEIQENFNINQENQNNVQENLNSNENNKKKEKSSDQWTCPICFDKLQSPVVTRCGHVFCYDCIDHWLSRSDKCPMCTKYVDRSELIVVPGHGETSDIGTQQRRDNSKWNTNDRPVLKQKIIFIILLLIFVFIIFQ